MRISDKAGMDVDADLDRAADIPLGAVRPRNRAPRDKPSSSSVGSGTRPPSLSQHAQRPGSSRRLANIPDADTDESAAPSVEQWLESSAPSARTGERRARRERAPSSSHRMRTDDTASVRERISRNDRAEVMSAKALSSSSRVLWPGRGDTASLRGDVGGDVGDASAKTYERIANWRERNAVASEAVEGIVPPSLRKSTSWLSGADTPSARSRPRTQFDALSVASSRRAPRASEAPTTATVPERRALPNATPYNADSPLRNVLRWMGQEEMQGMIPLLGYAAVVLVRWLVALGGYSGRGMPPMYGDFEAQRHWIELTLHLPTSRWYFYDLPYWGLDYPPLTAWVSMACGWVASLFPALRASFALDTSRGAESPGLLVFMRLSVLALEALVYMPAVAFFLERRLEGRSTRARHVALYTVLLQPALILIDHGHFQYNAVMLGLSAMSFALLYSRLPNVHVRAGMRPGTDTANSAGLQRMLLDSLSRQISYEYVIAAIFFSLSLCFKQMALYYAPAVFAVMLGRCVGLAGQGWRRGAWLFLGLGAATSATFLVAFLPWVGHWQSLQQCIVRIFPLARGLFEDKVANVWCFLSVLPLGKYKLHRAFAATTLAKVSLVATLVALLPGCILLFRAAVETCRLEMILDDAQAEQVVANVRRRGGSVASGREGTQVGSQRPTSVRESVARSVAPSAHESSRGSLSDRRSTTSGSLFAGSTSTWMANGAPRPRPKTRQAPARPQSSSPSPAATLLPYTLLSTSLAFFLLGFQTHEKSILLPLLPLTLLLTTKGDRTGAGAAVADWEWAVLANNVGVFGYVLPTHTDSGRCCSATGRRCLWCSSRSDGTR